MNKTYLLKVAADGTITRVPIESAENIPQLLREGVGGWLELVPNKTEFDLFIDEEGKLFVDEDGKLKQKPYNSLLTKFVQGCLMPDDYIVGDGIIAAHDEEGETLGLTDEQCDRLEALLKP